MKKSLWTIVLILALASLAACGPNAPAGTPGGPGEAPSAADDPSEEIADALPVPDFPALSDDISEEDAVLLPASAGVTEIGESGAYLLEGEYGGIRLTEDGLTLHLFLGGANIACADGPAIDGSEHKKAEVTLTLLEGTENSAETSADDANAVHVKGSLAINGTGKLSVTSEKKHAIKASKELTIVDAELELTAKGHTMSALSVSASSCSIHVVHAGKDGINAECDDETTAFTAEEGFVYLSDTSFTAETEGDGIQADTVVYIDGGTYSIKTAGTFVADSAENREEYALEADDFRYIKSGDGYEKVASDYRGGSLYALKQGCKGIKAGEIEYPDEDGSEVTVTEGDYAVLLQAGTFTIDATDDAIHANSGDVIIGGGSYTLSTLDDAVTADRLAKIAGGEIGILRSYEGIEGGYVEIAGGKVELVSSDDGINAASDDPAVTEHILISGGDIFVDAGGDGIDSNGSVLISGGNVLIAGPTSDMDNALDADRGILVNGGTLFAVGPIGMADPPSASSAQCSVFYGHTAQIAAGTELALVDGKGTALLTFTTPKACRALTVSCPALVKGQTYAIRADGKELVSFTVQDILTTLGRSSGGPGGMGPGGMGPGGRPSRG